MIKRLLLIFLGTAFVSITHAQSPQQILQWINNVKADNHNFYAEIPFEYRNGSIVIKVNIGQNTYDYVFDTGGYTDITDDIQDKNHFEILTTQMVGSSNKLKTRVNIVKVDSLKIGMLVFYDVAALQMNFQNSPTIACTINGALIGAGIIKKYCWQIDYEQKKIIVTDQPNKLPNLTGAIKLPVSFNTRSMPFINTSINGHKEKFMLDLGSSSSFILTEKTAANYTNGIKQFVVNGASSEGGNGVASQSMHVFGVASLKIGEIDLQHLPVYSMSTIVDNLIGNPIIKNYRVTLDFPDNAVYFSPLKTIIPKEGLETFGFTLKYDNGKITVATLYENSAADLAGLHLNDVVIAANENALRFPDQCAAITGLNNLLNSSSSINLSVLRDGKSVSIRIQKARLF